MLDQLEKKNIIPEILLSGKWDTIYTGVKFGLEDNFILSNEYLNEMRQVFLYIVENMLER